MKTFLPVLACLFIVLSCSSNDVNPENAAIRKACTACQTKVADMEWLRAIVQENNGNIYAIKTSDGTIIIHQPVYMSCLSCVRYSCSGASITSVSVTVQQELQTGMKNSNMIYKATF